MKTIDIPKSGVYKPGMNMSKTNTPQGQTNSANPTSLKKLQASYDALKRVEDMSIPKKSPKPTKQSPHVEGRYKKMGEAIGICPYELKAIMNGSFSEDQMLILTLLKKFVTAAKLSGAVDLSPIHTALKESEERYQNDLEQWKISSRKIEGAQRLHEKELAEKQKDFSTTWGDILIDLVTKISRNNDIKSLGEMDQLMVLAIARTGSKYCKVVKDNISLDFNNCKKMPAEDIISLRDVANTIKEERKYNEWMTWLNTASLEEMKSELLKSERGLVDLSYDQISDISFAISKKIGITAGFDDNGDFVYLYDGSDSDEWFDRPQYDWYGNPRHWKL
jgi:hypothetical protein